MRIKLDENLGAGLARIAREAGLRSALAEAAKESLRGRLWIVETGRIRKHGTPNSRESGAGSA
ncbi:MAG TPA: hypothetical protein VFI25_00285 [Planctomycetota bacterium]|jgi:hypothetical protein|nr:hypothetical protein [Planctomycetota bacterium]